MPLLGVVVDSIARTSLVRMSELRNCKNSSEEIVKVVSESCRKLWLIFFPVFVYLFLAAEEFIVVLFTKEYIDSVSIFRVFVFMIPVSAILVQHVLRAFAQTRFILANNILCLVLTVLFCLLGKRFMGLTGVAFGAVIAQIVWRYVFWWRCSSVLKVKMQALIPIDEIIKATMAVTFLGICFYVPKIVFDINSFFTLLYLFPFFFVCFYMYWKLNYLSEVEKSALVDIYNKLLHKFHI